MMRVGATMQGRNPCLSLKGCTAMREPHPRNRMQLAGDLPSFALAAFKGCAYHEQTMSERTAEGEEGLEGEHWEVAQRLCAARA